jgi:hypothetical protein
LKKLFLINSLNFDLRTLLRELLEMLDPELYVLAPRIIVKRACRTPKARSTSLRIAFCAIAKYFFLFPYGCPMVFTNVVQDG